MNVNDMMKMFGGQEETEESKRLNEVRAKLLDDRAIKEWENILGQIESMIGDIRGQVEAISFCKVYLKKLIGLSAEVANESGLPVEIAHILAQIVHPMGTFAISDRYEQVTENDKFMEGLAKNAKGKSKLTDEEIDSLYAEQETLKVVVAEQEAEDESEKDEEECDEEECCGGGCHGELDPKNPFGLN